MIGIYDHWESEALNHEWKSEFSLTVYRPLLHQTYKSTLLYLSGFVVGQAGLYQSITMLLVAYLIVTMTVLSVCAICTNGALDAGGAYCILHMLQHVCTSW